MHASARDQARRSCCGIIQERQAAMPAGGSQWAGIEDTLFEGFAQLLSFEQKMTCESVCKAWRSQLRDRPARSLWCSGVYLTEAGNSSLEEPLTKLCLPATAEASFALGGWLSQRAAGINHVQVCLSATYFGELPGEHDQLAVSWFHLFRGLNASTELTLDLRLLGILIKFSHSFCCVQ